MAKRTVEESSLILVADSIRAKAGKSDKLEFPSGFKSAIDGITKSEIKNQDITIKENGVYTPASGFTGFGSVRAEVEGSGGDIPDASTAEFGRVRVDEPYQEPTGKSYYNGVLLPDIPADVLAQYPCCWMRLDADGVKYSLILGSYIWYYNSSLFTQESTYVRYKATKDSEAWEYYKTYTDNGSFPLNDGLIWSNHDIPNGSATATDIYFEGSEAVQQTVTKNNYSYGGYVADAENYAVANEAINEIAHRMQKHYSTYDTFTGVEVRDFIKRCGFCESGTASSNLSLDFESSASGSLS